jgi:hypothetical protein
MDESQIGHDHLVTVSWAAAVQRNRSQSVGRCGTTASGRCERRRLQQRREHHLPRPKRRQHPAPPPGSEPSTGCAAATEWRAPAGSPPP